MMISDLPADLLDEILSRVPATSLIRLRSTCKQWYNLFKDQMFAEKHLRNVPKQLRVLTLKENRLFLPSVDLNFVPPSIEFSDELSLNNSNNSEEVHIDSAFHCDGLLLCTTRDELVVWNPCLGETMWIKHSEGSKRVKERKPMYALGYENNQSCRSYKILMFWDCDELYDGQVDGFKVYDFNSNAWRVVNYPNCFIMNSHGVNLKGNGYWNAYDDNYVDYILSFDFTGERFIRLCLPPPSQGCMYTSLSVVREELSVLRCVKGSSKIEMWVTTNKMDTSASELSWSKSFTMNFGFPVLVYTGLLIDEDKKVVLCNTIVGDHLRGACTIGEEDKYYSEITFEGMSLSPPPHIFNYVPSLVRIQEGTELDVFGKSPRRRGDDPPTRRGDTAMCDHDFQFSQEIDDMMS